MNFLMAMSFIHQKVHILQSVSKYHLCLNAVKSLLHFLLLFHFIHPSNIDWIIITLPLYPKHYMHNNKLTIRAIVSWISRLPIKAIKTIPTWMIYCNATHFVQKLFLEFKILFNNYWIKNRLSIFSWFHTKINFLGNIKKINKNFEYEFLKNKNSIFNILFLVTFIIFRYHIERFNDRRRKWI